MRTLRSRLVDAIAVQERLAAKALAGKTSYTYTHYRVAAGALRGLLAEHDRRNPWRRIRQKLEALVCLSSPRRGAEPTSNPELSEPRKP